MLDEFEAATGYHRKYANRLLKHGRPRLSGKKHGLPKVYQGEVVVAHCGETAEGQYLSTLTCVDLSTGWIECLAVRQHISTGE